MWFGPQPRPVTEQCSVVPFLHPVPALTQRQDSVLFGLVIWPPMHTTLRLKDTDAQLDFRVVNSYSVDEQHPRFGRCSLSDDFTGLDAPEDVVQGGVRGLRHDGHVTPPSVVMRV